MAREVFAIQWKQAVAEAVQLQRLRKGYRCECCGKWCKAQQRVLNSQMANFLFALLRRTRKTGKRWHTSRELIGGTHKSSTDGTMLRHWGLIRKQTGVNAWAITRKGRQFVKGHISVARAIFTYNRGCIGFADETTTINEALTEKGHP